MTLDALPPLREVIRASGLRASKSFGQNFLLDMNLTRRIVDRAEMRPDLSVAEIGPGPGGLTRALLESPARNVTAIEMDRRCIGALDSLVEAAEGRLTLIEGDALKTDIAALIPAPRAIVANLPYNIATPLLIGWLRDIDSFDSLTLMFQAEVADRLVAPPGSDAFGRLSVITQWAASVKRVMDLPPGAFTPPPKVRSSVVRFTPRVDRPLVDLAALEAVTAAAFGQRRKMLRASLKTLGRADWLLSTAGIEPTLRAEQLTIDAFVSLARALAEARQANADRAGP